MRWPGCFARGEPVGGDEVLGIAGGLAGYAGYLIRPDGSEAETGGFTFAS